MCTYQYTFANVYIMSMLFFMCVTNPNFQYNEQEAWSVVGTGERSRELKRDLPVQATATTTANQLLQTLSSYRPTEQDINNTIPTHPLIDMRHAKSLLSKFQTLDYLEISLGFILTKYMCRCLAVFICCICINLANKGIHSMVKYVTNVFPCIENYSFMQRHII